MRDNARIALDTRIFKCASIIPRNAARRISFCMIHLQVTLVQRERGAFREGNWHTHTHTHTLHWWNRRMRNIKKWREREKQFQTRDDRTARKYSRRILARIKVKTPRAHFFFYFFFFFSFPTVLPPRTNSLFFFYLIRRLQLLST